MIFNKSNKNFLKFSFCTFRLEFPPARPQSPSAPAKVSSRNFEISNSRNFKPKKFFNDKRGFLLAEETIKILIALVALIFLIYFLVSIYSAKVNGEKLKYAEDLIERFRVEFNALSNVSDGEKEIGVFNPKGWYVFSFSGDALKPNSCANKNCLCVCDNVLWEGFKKDRQQNECSEKGVCLIWEDIGEFSEVKITGDLKILNIIKTGGKIYIFEK